jgi:hypothetical protein
VVTSNEKSEIALNEIRDAILSAGNLYSKRPDLFRLFGDFDGTKDLLFKVRSFCGLSLPTVPCDHPLWEQQPISRLNSTSCGLWFGESPTFWRNIPPPSSGSKREPRKEPADAHGKLNFNLRLRPEARLAACFYWFLVWITLPP